MTTWAGVELPLKMVSATGLTFVPLTPALVEQDYAAVMRDVPMLRAWSGQDWPTDDFPIEWNLEDLQRHDREQQEGVALTYSVLLAEVVQGCIYVRPLAEALATREVTLPPEAAGALDDIVVRGWLHDRPAADLIGTTLRLLTTGKLVAGRLWWQTNSKCPDQLAACDDLGLTDALELEGTDRTWILRSRPS
ncbi:MAG: hypothetical protein ABMA25_16940 [Ilumatobacteraceae bacterium]